MGSPTTPYLLVAKRSRDLFLELWDPSISQKQFKLEISNLACRMITRNPYKKKIKIRSKGSQKGHVTYF